MVFCCWVCTVKCLPNGSVKHFKAHLVAKGYTHIYIYGVDYLETFPVARLNSLQILLYDSVSHSWPLYQLDISVYGLVLWICCCQWWTPCLSIAKGLVWSEAISLCMVGSIQCYCTWVWIPVLYFYSICLCLSPHHWYYCHDCLCEWYYLWKWLHKFVDLKSYLAKQFHTKDLGVLHYLLKIGVACFSQGIFLA